MSPNDDKEMLDKTLAILEDKSPDIKANTKFLTSNMCKQTIEFYKEIS